MAKKNDNTIYYIGGAALIAWLIFKPKKPQPTTVDSNIGAVKMADEVHFAYLRNGVKVLAVNDKKYGIIAKTFVNYKQAEVQQMILTAMGIDCSVYEPPTNSRVKFIAIKK